MISIYFLKRYIWVCTFIKVSSWKADWKNAQQNVDRPWFAILRMEMNVKNNREKERISLTFCSIFSYIVWLVIVRIYLPIVCIKIKEMTYVLKIKKKKQHELLCVVWCNWRGSSWEKFAGDKSLGNHGPDPEGPFVCYQSRWTLFCRYEGPLTHVIKRCI